MYGRRLEQSRIVRRKRRSKDALTVSRAAGRQSTKPWQASAAPNPQARDQKLVTVIDGTVRSG